MVLDARVKGVNNRCDSSGTQLLGKPDINLPLTQTSGNSGCGKCQRSEGLVPCEPLTGALVRTFREGFLEEGVYHLIAEGRLGVNWALKGGQTIVTMGRASLKAWHGGPGKGRMREESH